MKKIELINPANGKRIQEFECDSQDVIHEKFNRAKKAQKSWAAEPFEVRLKAISRFKDLLIEQRRELAFILTQEVGKPITQSMNELTGVIARIDFFLNESKDVLKEDVVFNEGSMREVIRHEPLGVIANISAWNYPYNVGVNAYIPALIAGNAVLYKPSEFALLTGLKTEELLHQAGIPKDVFITVIGGGDEGRALLSEKIDGVFFTGSYATGKKIAESAAPRMLKFQLELGGKDPVYVCEDAPVKAAAESTADGAMYNSGQSCCSVERIYVHEKIYDEFLDHFLKAVKSFALGDPAQEKTYFGALTRRKAHQDFLSEQLQDAVKKGAKIEMGGKPFSQDGGFYFEPTVLTNVSHSMSIMREESFGPVIGIQKVKSDEEAVELMNDSEYGLTAGVYTPDQKRAEKILSQVNSGSAYWNCCDRVSPRLPWSGRGHSGVGSTLSLEGIRTFTKPKAFHLKNT